MLYKIHMRRFVHQPPEKFVDLMVPAHAEFVIEGSVSATETMLEGPFGDHTGFYSDADEYPVINIKAITRKKFPIYCMVTKHFFFNGW